MGEMNEENQRESRIDGEKNRTKRVSKVKVRAAMKRMKSGKPLRIFMNAIK